MPNAIDKLFSAAAWMSEWDDDNFFVVELRAALPAAKDEHALLLSIIATLRKACKAAEWGGELYRGLLGSCPVCGASTAAGHKPDCILSAALEASKENSSE